MALLFMESFDHLGHAGQPTGKWASGIQGWASGALPVARTGGFTGNIAGFSIGQTKTYVTSGGCIVGFAVYPAPGTTSTIIQVKEGSTIHLEVDCDSTDTSKLVIKRGATILQTSAAGTWVAGGWIYIDLKCVIDDTVGSYQFRIDGVPIFTASGIDTKNGGTGIWDNVGIGGGNGGSIDDFYLADTSGAAPWNDFLGSIKVECLVAQTDAVAVGSNTGLTPSTGTDHGALVDEVPANTTDYNSAATVGLKDTYNFPSMTLSGTIMGVQTNMYVAKSDTSARQVCSVVRAGGVDYDGANVSPLTTFNFFSEMRMINPNTGVAWVAADITSLQAGMKVTV